MLVTVMVQSEGAPFGRRLNDVDGMDCVMGAFFMRVRRRRRQNPELGDGERQKHAQKAISPFHNASLPPILYLGMKARRHAKPKLAVKRPAWPALAKK